MMMTEVVMGILSDLKWVVDVTYSFKIPNIRSVYMYLTVKLIKTISLIKTRLLGTIHFI